jgi:diaminohydroxyphosphoribosylaminopyrimidine deaminase/5-amino-6-(5-phosphoribosylamino)uracil reductase
VNFACRDPNPLAQGGAARLREAGTEVQEGLLRSEARAANEFFLMAMERGRAVLVLKAATSADGSLGFPDRQTWLTGTKARKSAHRLRAECGAVLVGRRTIEVDDPLLTARISGVRNQPIRIVVDPQGSLGDGFRVFQTQGQTWRVTAHGKGGDIQLNESGGDLDVPGLLKELHHRGIRAVLVEGGVETLRRFWASGLTDRVELFVAPTILGGGMVWEEGLALREGRCSDFSCVDSQDLDGDLHFSFRR